MSDSGEIPIIKSPDWLPVDWTMEVKSRNGKNIKSYIHPQTGYKFYSKPKVLEYLRTVKKDSSTLQKETVINGNAGSDSYGYVTEIPQENGLHSGKSYEIEASELLQSEEMDAETSANWLPADWTEEIKVQDGQTVKNYVDPLWGHRFSSKRQVFDYLGALTKNSCTAQKETPAVSFETNLPGKTNGTQVSLPYVSTLTTPLKNGSQSKSPMKTMDSTKSLPDGWIIETKPRKSGPRAGYPDKQYIDPVTGRKFKSKQKVFEYLGIVEPNSSTSQQKETVLDYVSNFNLNVDTTEDGKPLQMVESQNVETLNHTGFSSISKETSSGEQPGRKLSPEGLPPGMTKEVKTQKSADKTRNISYFIDPVSGYVFASRKDAWRYSESGDINKCVKRPKKRGEMGFVSLNMDKTKDVTSLPHLVESQNVKALDDVINSSPTNERSFGMRLRRQTNINESGSGTPPPQLGQSQNVETLNHTDNSSISKETSSSEQPQIKSGMERLLPEGLPPGWIKEVKPQKFAHKTKNVSYFIDPVSGYVFASQKDAWRYSESGDISQCVKRPKKRGEMGFVSLPLNTRDSTKPLPDGWITRTKGRKFGFRAVYKQYIDPVKGYIFTSLTDAWRYLEAGDISKCVKKPNKRGEMGLATRQSSTNIDETDGGTPPPKLVESVSVETLNHAGYSSISKQISSSEQPERKIGMEQLSPEGLPPGWIKKVKTQKFANMTRNVSYFIDPMSGYVFTSKKDAWRFIETGNITKCVKRPKKREEMGFVSLPLKTMDSTTPLPDGWITETKPRKFGSRATEKQYIDPVSGYVFTSRTDVWRYLEAGDISKCVKKPKKIGEMGSATEQSSDASPAVMHELECGTTEKQPSTGKNAGSKRGSETADTDVSRKRRQRRTPEATKDIDSSINLKMETRFSRRVLNNEQALSFEAGNNGENDEILNSQDRSFQHFGEDDWSTLDDAIETLDGTLAFEDNAQVDNIFQTDTSQVLDFGEPNNLLSSTIFLPDMNCTFPSGSKAGPSKLAWKRTRK